MDLIKNNKFYFGVISGVLWTAFILILFLLIFQTCLASTYGSDPKVFVQELVNDSIPIFGILWDFTLLV